MIKIRGTKSRQLKIIASIPRRARQEIRKALYHSGKDIAGIRGSVNDGLIKQEINKKPKSGRTYIVSRGIGGAKLQRPRRHKASRVGQSPAVITGALRESVGFKVEGFRRLEISAGGAGAPYARFLELGTSKIAARRFMIRPIIRSRRNIINNFSRALRNATK